MNREVRRFCFEPSVPAREIENSVLLAIVAAEGLHGHAAVRLDARYSFDPAKGVCVIDAGSDVGRDLCRIFTGFAIREFGEAAVTIARTESEPAAKQEGMTA